MNSNLWLMEPEQHRLRMENYTTYMGTPEFLRESAAFSASDLPGLEIIEGVAVIDFSGPITNKDSFFSFLFGEAVLPHIRALIGAAELDPKVEGIVLNIDSPGGPPAGLSEFTEFVSNLSKPIVGFTDGMAASGGYWALSSLDGSVVSTTASVGSIGVIAVLREQSKLDKDIGITDTVVRAGKYKALGNRFEKLTDEGRAVIQAEVDYMYSVFVDVVAENKGISIDEALAMADGKIFIGQQAVDAGLVDKIGSLNDAIEMALNINNGGTAMGDILIVSELKAEYPELCAEIKSAALASVEMPDVPAAVAVETERIISLGLVHFGAELGEKFKGLVVLGVSVDQYKAMKALTPEPEPDKTDEELKADHLAALEALKLENPGAGGEDGPATFEAAWKAIKAEKECDTQTAMSAAAKAYPELHEAQKTPGGA